MMSVGRKNSYHLRYLLFYNTSICSYFKQQLYKVFCQTALSSQQALIVLPCVKLLHSMYICVVTSAFCLCKSLPGHQCNGAEYQQPKRCLQCGSHVTCISIITALETTTHIPVIKVETATMGHADDFSVGSECATVKCTATYGDAITSIVINACQLDACCSWEQSIASLASSHTWCFYNSSCEIIVKWIIACRIVPV